MPSFDVHQHLWPAELLAELAARREPPCLQGPSVLATVEGAFPFSERDHDPERRLELLDHDGIDVTILSLQPTLGIERLPESEQQPLLAAWHEGTSRLRGESGGRLLAFAQGVALPGFAGACLPAEALLGDVSRVSALGKRLIELGQVLFVHPGPAETTTSGPSWWTGVVDYTAQMQAAYFAWLANGQSGNGSPPVVFALLAGGGPVQLERLASRGREVRLALDSGVYFEVSSYGRRTLELCFATFGVRQLLYGSDVPVIDPAPTLHAVRSFGDAVATVICDENATLLFA